MERQAGADVDFVFHTNVESGKIDDLAVSPKVNLGFVDKDCQWASVSGFASVETDRARVHEYYVPSLKAWFGDMGDGVRDGGPSDPRIGIIKVKSVTAQYAVSRRTTVGGLLEVAKGALTGDVAQVMKLRHLSEGELERCRSCSITP